jgi:hypothetical protein
VSGRLDDEKLETLRSWGTGLAAEGRDELRAAGKAILILIEEIERLQVDVWHTREPSSPGSESEPSQARSDSEAMGLEPPPTLDTTLRGVVRRFLHPRSAETR